MAHRMFKALPPYFGGKRNLVPQIFRHVPPAREAPVFVDAFLGGGSVALYAKARGHRVIANDIAERSAIVGRAVIANGVTRLSADDAVVLIAPPTERPRFVEEHYAPDYFLVRDARLIDGAMERARQTSNPVRRDLLRLAVMHFVLRWRPFGDFHQAGFLQKLVDGDCDELNPRVFRTKPASMLRTPALERMRRILDDMRGGVFSNGQENAFHQEDVLDFVRCTSGDVLYLDPPYWGSNAYEKVYQVLDSIIAGELIERPVSRFNQREAREALVELLEHSTSFPLWLLSFGGGRIDAQECREIVARFRPAEIVPVQHRYHYGDAGGRRADSKEILVIGRAA